MLGSVVGRLDEPLPAEQRACLGVVLPADGRRERRVVEAVDRLIDQQSQELDRDKRQKLVWQIQKQLESDVARPMLGWRKEYFTQWPHVKNLVAHNSLYNWGRMQDVWLDK